MFESFKKFVDMVFKGMGIVFMLGVFIFVIIAFKSCQNVYLDDKTEVRR